MVSQALAAVYFYRLFKSINNWAALALVSWGTVNAIAIMISAIAMAGAISIANSSAAAADQLLAVQLLQNLITHSWGIGGLFFGLWFFPMGYIIMQSQRMPVWLGRLIFVGGFGYVLSTIIHYAGWEFAYNNTLTIPATIGEFWIIGYMLVFGIRPEKQ